MCGMDGTGSGYDLLAGFCEHDNELLGPIKGGEFLEKLIE
jgi:hypothetical protein